ncbi:hypothetical protein B0H63DRAFT_504369 [Podospora didyma]|uniref:Glucose-methanol-choline oxidoreductase N-terminal domain-containing protein n=1 Tax=Podospora didyma TaxID=330526 RepID=A0AAE0K2Z4_9PEZI|nr:hypothetical protein B0H63DRAFT_504369 [Podospora didyma]
MKKYLQSKMAIAGLRRAGSASALKARHVKHLADLRSSYDYVVVGGGTAELTVADRLSESTKRNASDPNSGGFFAHQYNITSQPQTELGNRIVSINVGFGVGGSSAINGMAVMRGNAIHFVPPDLTLAADFNITYDIEAAWGQYEDTHVYASYPGGLNSSIKTTYNALKSVPGLDYPQDGHAGSHGVFFYPVSVDPATRLRSYSRTGHWDFSQSRNNYDIITGVRANKILFDHHNVATGVQFVSKSSHCKTVVRATKEIVLSAGAIHTPQVLQLSGIGPAQLLKKANIPVRVNLPGVGSNFQDHPVSPPVFFRYQNPPPTPPTSSTHLPPSEGQGQGLVAYLNLPITAPDEYEAIASRYESQDIAAFSPPGTPAAVLAGYRAQQAIFAREMRRTNVSFLNYVVFAFPGGQPINLHIASRGTVNINASSPESEPLVDYRALSNPTDVDLMVAYIQFIRRLFGPNGPLAEYGPIETTPGAANTSTHEQLSAYVRAGYFPAGAHPIGTAAKMRRELGGVVDDELKVYEVKGLRVADASIMPVLIGGATQLTAYAIGEKAAAMIKGTW